MAAVGLAIAIPVTLIARGGGDGGTSPPTGPAAPQLQSVTADSNLGVRYRLPAGWAQSEKHGEINLHSADGATGVIITAPAPPGETAGVLNDALGKLHDGAKSFDTIAPVAKQDLGGLSGVGAAVKIVNGEGTTVRVLLSALDGHDHTYLVQSFSANPGPALTEAQALLNTLELTG